MSKKWIYKIAAFLLPLAVLAGCGDGTDETMESIISSMEPVEMGAALEGEKLNLEQKTEETEVKLQYRAGALTMDAQVQVLEAMTTLHQNLEIPEYLGEGIHMVSDETWMQTMSQEIYEGSRSYSLQKGEEELLTVQVGYDIQGKPYANVFFPGEGGSILVLKQAENTTWLLQTSVSDGKYEGKFETWLLDSAVGHIQREEGTYSGGVIVGEYTKSEYTGEPGDAFDLWTNRENFEYETTTAVYDETGEPVDPSPEPTEDPEEASEPAGEPGATPKPTRKPASTSKPTQKPAATPKPTQKPAATPKPTQKPAAAPEPTQKPAESTPAPQQPTPATPQPTPEPQPPAPEPTPEPAPEPSQGGDTDIEWGEDLL